MDETAILLAAGLGERMRPLTEKISKPLVRVRGVPLIETVLHALHRRGVRDIYIVTGYLGGQFGYLTAKYPGVRLVENKEYREKNNISSVRAVGEVLGSADCFICEADLYVRDPDVLKHVGGKSGYLGKMVPGHSDDWAFFMEGRRIIRIGRGAEDAYNMAGISYWKREDALKIRNAIDELYRTQGHGELFWDEAVNRVLGEMDVRVYEVPGDSVIEVDTAEELEMLEGRLRAWERSQS